MADGNITFTISDIMNHNMGIGRIRFHSKDRKTIPLRIRVRSGKVTENWPQEPEQPLEQYGILLRSWNAWHLVSLQDVCSRESKDGNKLAK